MFPCCLYQYLVIIVIILDLAAAVQCWIDIRVIRLIDIRDIRHGISYDKSTGHFIDFIISFSWYVFCI